MTWASVDIQRRRNVYMLPAKQQKTIVKTIVKEVPTSAQPEPNESEQIVVKLEPYLARIASALEVANQLETQKQLVENRVENVVSETLSESVSDKATSTVGIVGKKRKEYSTETMELVKKYRHLKPAQIIQITELSKTTVYDILGQLKQKVG